MNEICDKMGTATEEELEVYMEELGTIQDLLTMHDFYMIDSKVEEVARALGLLDLGLEKEYFGIAFRSGSDLTRKVEDITLELIKDGKLEELSTKYEVGAVGEADYVPKADACATSSDFAEIKAKGKLVIGITDYKPMDYKDENGNWIGFDAEYAKLVCEKLGVVAEFKEIDWDNKLFELEGKTIDCNWNGMTITDAIEAAADCTAPYMYNT
jgi:polar amino acid transport system substrate-binding protein